jgi:hypothetical protein
MHCIENQDKDKDKKTSKNIMHKNNIWKKPTITEVNKYIKVNNYIVDGEKWYNFYESKGWMVGKNKMKDWKASIRTWNKPEDKHKIRIGEM